MIRPTGSRPEQPAHAAQHACPRSAAPGPAQDADAFVRFLLRRLRETINQTRPRSQLLGLCVAPARADLAALMRSFDGRQRITAVSSASFALEGQSAIHDFVCRIDSGQGLARVVFGRVARRPEGWRLALLYQLPSAAGCRSTV